MGSSKTSFIRREVILGKSVVGQDALIVGTVKDLAVSIDGKMAIQVARKNPSLSGSEEDLFVSSDEILAVGDLVLLKSVSTQAGGGQNATSAAAVPRPSSVAFGQSAPPPYPGTTSQGKTCPRCNYINNPSSKFCIKCGAPLSS